MTINSLQVGQNIAASNIAVERTSAPQVDEQRVDVNTDVPLRTDNSQQNVTVDVQESDTNADNQDNNENTDALQQAVSDIETFVQAQARNLAFALDEDTNRSVVSVLDTESGDLIRQIPSEEVLELAQRIQTLQEDVGSSVGVLINGQV